MGCPSVYPVGINTPPLCARVFENGGVTPTFPEQIFLKRVKKGLTGRFYCAILVIQQSTEAEVATALVEEEKERARVTVKEIIEKSAELLGVELTDKNIEYWLNAYNNVENELAMDYFSLRTVDKVLIKENKVKYGNLQRQAWRIMGVHDCDNHELKYKLYPTYMAFTKKDNGKQCFVQYCYVPQEKTIDGISEFDKGMFEDVFKYGVCSEYCIIQGDYETASFFNEKYKNAILERYAKRKRSDDGRNG